MTELLMPVIGGFICAAMGYTYGKMVTRNYYKRLLAWRARQIRQHCYPSGWSDILIVVHSMEKDSR